MDSGFDALGALFLPTASAEDWATEIIRDAAKGEPAMEAAVKFGRYVLHPTPLLILNDATRMLGEALYSSNVRRLVGCVHEIHATMDRGCGPGTSLRPRGARRRTRVRAVGPGVPSSRDDAVSTVDEPQRPNGVENVGRRSEGLGGRSL